MAAFLTIYASIYAPIVVLLVGVICLHAVRSGAGISLSAVSLQQGVTRCVCSCFLFILSCFLRFALVFCS